MAYKANDARASGSDIVLRDTLVYKGEHSVTFTKNGVSKHTWNDWGLIPSSRPSEPINGVWSHGVSLNGINGQEDLVRMYPYNAVNSYSRLRSALLNDNQSYIKSNYGYDILTAASGSLSFTIADQETSFFAKEQEIVNFLHGQVVTMKFSDDSTKTYTVRTTVESFSSGAKYSGFSINYAVLNQ